MSLSMSQNDLYELTGYKQPKRQIEWLTNRHWRFATTHLGRPKVAIAYYNMKMGVHKTDITPVQPNWGAVA